MAELVGKVVINTTQVTVRNSTNVTSNQAYLTCLLNRANGARFKFTVAKFTKPSSNYIGSLKGGSSGSTMASGRRLMSSATAVEVEHHPELRRHLAASTTLNDSAVASAIAALSPGGEWLAGFSHGYPVYSSFLENFGQDMSHIYNMSGNTTLSSNRIIGEKNNLLLGGVLLHQTRKPLSSVYAAAAGDSACTSQFFNLKTDCISSATVSLTYQDNGWYGKDPIYYNRSTLYSSALASELVKTDE